MTADRRKNVARHSTRPGRRPRSASRPWAVARGQGLSRGSGRSWSTDLALDFVAWGIVHASTGYLVHRLPERVFRADGWWWRPWGFEDGGGFYVGQLGIRRWKHLLPEAGGWFAGGFSKRALVERSPAYLAVFAAETRRAELGHWLALACGPLFALWNPRRAVVWLQAYAVASNLPCIAAQRYNRIRLARVIARAQATGPPGHPPPATRHPPPPTT